METENINVINSNPDLDSDSTLTKNLLGYERTQEKVLTPSAFEMPTYLMNPPISFSNEVANNKWMQDALNSEVAEDTLIDKSLAMSQWFDIYNFLASEAYVQVLPTPSDKNLQDLVFTSNLGSVMVHLKDKNTFILSNFNSAPRKGEEQIGLDYFKQLGYNIYQSPYYFEGNAELIWLKDNIYIGGYGQRSDIQTYHWLEEKFDCKIIKVNMTNPYLYHLDCSIFNLTQEELLICTEAFEKEELNEIEKHTNLIPVEPELAAAGITNSVRFHNTILNASDIHDLNPASDKEDYELERDKNRALEDIAVELGMEVTHFNISEFMKGGGLLSCLVLPLNWDSHQIELT